MDQRDCGAGTARLRMFVRGVALAALLATAGAQASFHTFRIEEIYSDPTGNVQFIELHESSGADFQNLFAGQALTSSGAGSRVYTFPTNLPATATANKHVLIGTAAFASLAGVAPDYVISGPFLFPGGGSLDFAGVDSISYPAFPADPTKSLDRSGNPGTNSPTNFAGQTGSIGPPAPGPAVPGGQGIPTLDTAGLLLLSLGVLVAGFVLSRRRT